MAAIVGALGMLVVGVSLLAVPADAPMGSRTQVDGIFAVASPSPSAHADRPVPTAPAAPTTPTPSAAAVASPAAPSPFSISGPGHISPWTTAKYRVTLNGTGARSVDIWWTGAAMGDWTWQRLDGHCELTPTRDRLSGTATDLVVIELDLTPSGAPGGQLVFYGREAGGQTYTLVTATVN